MNPTNTITRLAVPLVEFTASVLTHVNEVYTCAPASYRVAGPLVEPNFGLVGIEWKESGVPLITLSAVRADGSVAFTHEVNLATAP